ncbi:MAG: tRNA (adenosine(37)-N6)-threonylcarbamoyltransferase complex dimerization subunit type 1 TsaB [Planctomycetes bacterium]|nr:tRNA (adenosine(37)-N6)-threonylcarbamoyltransferase complex dimerization subunit type 1 TsaB [Planctomycetota bacterium]
MAEGCVLAVESSAPDGGGAALLRDNSQILYEALLHEGIRGGQGIAPAVQECLQESKKLALPLLGLAVDIGPGSYTGLRVGVIFTKAFAFGRNLPLCGIHSLDAIAWQERLCAKVMVVITEARKNELYVAVYDCTDTSASRRKEIQALSPEEIIPLIAELPAGAMVIGSGLKQLEQDKLIAAAPQVRLGEPLRAPSPRAIAELGLRSLMKNPQGEPVQELQPVYPRRKDVSMPILGEAVEKYDE